MDKVFNGIVIFGEMGAGKDTLAEQFCALRENAKIYKMSVLCREMMKVSKVNPMWRGRERYIGQTVADKLRELDDNIMCDYILALIYERWQDKYGWDNSTVEEYDYKMTLLKQLEIIRNEELSIIVGGRTLTDLHYFKTKGYLVVGIKVSEEVRRERLIARDGEVTVKNSSFEHNTESEVPYIINNLCDELIVNNGTINDLKRISEEILTKYNF
ncbi:hypothetical protein M2651_04225 [Clostridium sp. SYSU_GA19001]|uniref:hypothetical protein n=1 Tax=Clostridium caldaquaticum TaxID=2940653 RepID=UPI0020777999|nr:hypothetical protein [Clostridium caldaquaticum]MCM8710233.1 hypothetical protein [Clostridium caldaquaticum]